MRELVVLPEADAELRGAAKRYEQARTGLGHDFLEEVGALMARIQAEGHTFPIWEEGLPFRKAVVLHRFPFVVFFTETPETIVVFAIAHGKRPPGYWLHRANPAR